MEATRQEVFCRDEGSGAVYQASSMPGIRTGVLIRADVASGVWIVCEGMLGNRPIQARSTVQVRASDEGRTVLLVFEGEDPSRPVIVGLIQEQPVGAPLPPAEKEKQAPNVTIDGRQVRLEADRELVLRCGKSSVVLRADGQVVIKGVKVVSRARNMNKVKGATVQIN